MISVLGAVFVLATGLALLLRPAILPWILSAAVPFSATAGVTVAGQSIVMYPLVALVVVAVALRRAGLTGVLAADTASRPGLRPLIAFAAWAVAVTLVAPVAFAGMSVLNPRVGIDDGVKSPALLAFGISNLAQVGYLVIGVATVVALASWPGLSARVPITGFALGTMLSSLRSMLPDSMAQAVFDNSANVSYTSGEFDGIERMRGIFSEPSALGAFSVAAAVFLFMSASDVRGARRGLLVGVGGWALVNAVLSFSGGAVVSALIVLALVAGSKSFSYVTGRMRLSAAGLTAALIVVIVVALAAPVISAFVGAIFTDKAGSSSYENRNAADAFSYDIATQTLGLGVGVGSNRPSSFVASLLSTTGLIGSALFLAAVALIVMLAVNRPACRPAAGALLAIVVSKIVAGPDLSEPAMWFLLGVCASSTWGDRPASGEQCASRDGHRPHCDSGGQLADMEERSGTT